MAESTRPAPRNRILALLPPDDYTTIVDHLEPIELETRQLVFDVDQPIDYVYFPEATVISIVGVMADGGRDRDDRIRRHGGLTHIPRHRSNERPGVRPGPGSGLSYASPGCIGWRLAMMAITCKAGVPSAMAARLSRATREVW